MTIDLKTAAKNLFDLDLSAQTLALFDAYTALLLDWNAKINLTSITTPDEIVVKHFLDSLSLLTLPDLPTNPRVIDVGAGGGLPGFALKFARPDWHITLNDATGKKVNFMHTVIKELKLTGIDAFQMRAEDAAHDEQHREAYDLVVARAVARLPTLAEYLLPLCKVGGLCVAMKGDTAPKEVKDAAYAVQTLGGYMEGQHPVDLPTVEQVHYLVCIRKVETTRPVYPRRAGQPKKSPLTH